MSKEQELYDPFVVLSDEEAAEYEAEKKRYQPFDIVKSEDVKDPDKIRYLFLYEGTYDGEEIRSYEFIIGRENIYTYVKNMIDMLDVDASMVIPEDLAIKKALTVREFIILMKTMYFAEDDFDVSPYIKLEEEE